MLFNRISAAGAVVLVLGLVLGVGTADAQERVCWTMQSAFGSQLPQIGDSGVRFSKNIERLSGGRLEIKVFEPGEMQTKHGVKIHRWSDADLATFEKAWLEVLKEEPDKDPPFKKIADHDLDYRKKYAVWGASQVIKPTYLVQ